MSFRHRNCMYRSPHSVLHSDSLTLATGCTACPTSRLHFHHHAYAAVSRLSHLPLMGSGLQFGQLASRYVTPTGLVVVSAPKSRRAARAGLLVGDRIVLVNGHSADGETPAKVATWVLEQPIADLVVLHDPQLATALITHSRSSGNNTPRESPKSSRKAPPASTAVPSATGGSPPLASPPKEADSDSKPSQANPHKKQQPYEEHYSEDEEGADAVGAPPAGSAPSSLARPPAAPQPPSTKAAPTSTSSTHSTAPFAWQAPGLTVDQKTELLARRREELLSVDLARDPALREEWQCLLSDRDAILKREFIREFGAPVRGGSSRRNSATDAPVRAVVSPSAVACGDRAGARRQLALRPHHSLGHQRHLSRRLLKRHRLRHRRHTRQRPLRGRPQD